MPAKRLLPSDATLIGWRMQGYKYREIQDLVQERTGYKPPVGTIGSALNRAGFTSRVRYADEIPWRVAQEHQREYPVVMLRIIGKANRGAGLTTDEYKRVLAWLDKLDQHDVVVDYDRQSGFRYVPRREGESIIRTPRKKHRPRRSFESLIVKEK